MLWIKRNLFFVLGLLVAVGLLGHAIYLLLDKFKQDTLVKDELETHWSSLKGFYGMEVFPNNENLKALANDQAKLTRFISEGRALFNPVAPVRFSGAQGFKTALDNAVSALNAKANKAGVLVPTNYYYSFQGQAQLLNFSLNSMRIMAHQLAEIQQFCDILFDAKINRLEAIQRARAGDDSTLATGLEADYVAEPIRATPQGTVYPYQLTFRCFSSELAAVMEGLVKSPHGFIVKSLQVEPVALEFAPSPGAFDVPVPPTPGTPPRLPPRGPRGGTRPMPGAGVAPFNPLRPAAKTNLGGLQTVLNEKPFRVVMRIEAVSPPGR